MEIFVESRQINNSRTRHFRGTGTHLSLVQTQRHGFSPSSLPSREPEPTRRPSFPRGTATLISPIDLHLELFLREPAYLSHFFRFPLFFFADIRSAPSLRSSFYSFLSRFSLLRDIPGDCSTIFRFSIHESCLLLE